jgi:hypothetical protein
LQTAIRHIPNGIYHIALLGGDEEVEVRKPGVLMSLLPLMWFRALANSANSAGSW